MGRVGGNSYLFFHGLTGPSVVLVMISVNKIIKKLAKGVKGYLRLRSIVKFHHVFSGALLLLFGPPGHFLGGYGGDSCFLGSFVVIFNLPEVRFGLQTGKSKMKG